MNRPLLKDGLLWGGALWLIGYILGFIFFAFVPTAIIGWVIMPFGVALTLWVVYAKIKSHSLPYYAALGAAWAIIAIVCDYLFLVQLLKPIDGYYKLDVYLYYALTLLLPVLVGWYKNRAQDQHRG